MKFETKVVCTLTKDEKGQLIDLRDSLGRISRDMCNAIACDGTECVSCPIDDMVCKIRGLMGEITELVKNS